MTFNIKRGDRLPLFTYKLRNGDGTVPDLTSTTVVVNMRYANSDTLLINRASAVIVDAVQGIVRYAWQTIDTAVPATLEAEFEVTFTDGKRATYPNDGFISVVIGADLG